MKKLIKKINSNYKIWAILIFILSLIILVVAKNEDLSSYFKTILISLSINLLSSIIIIYLIDIKKEIKNDKELYNKRKLLLKEIILPINKFDSFVINVYKSTVSKDEFETFAFTEDDISKIMENLKKIDNEKPGYIYELNKKRSMVWKEIFITQIAKYVDALHTFYNNKSPILTDDLNDNIYDIVSTNYNKNIWEHILKINGDIETKDLLKVTNLENILKDTFKIKKILINDYEFKDVFNLKMTTFTGEHMAPDFESSL